MRLLQNKRLLTIGTITFVIVISLIIIIPIVIVTTGSDKPAGKKPFDPTQLNNDEKSRINCFLEEESEFENLTQYLCEERGCTYKPSEFERVPTCFFNRTNIGYLLESQQKNEYKLKRDRKAKLPYIGSIENLNLDIEYLGDSIVHVKVIISYK